MLRFLLSIWKTCQTCKGSRTVTDANGNKVTCPACNGAGGIDTGNV